MATGERVGRDTSADVSGRTVTAAGGGPSATLAQWVATGSVSASGSLVTSTGSTTARTLAARFADVANVRDFGAVGNGVADDTAAIQAAVAALPSTDGVLVFPRGVYSITDTITISKAGTRVRGHGAKIVQSGVTKSGLSVTAARVEVEGLWLYNTRGPTEWAAGQFVAVAVKAASADNLRVHHCRLENWARAGVQVYQTNDAEIRSNTIVGIGAAGGLVANSNNTFGVEGYLSGLGYAGLRVLDNAIFGVAQGVFAGEDWNGTLVRGNRIDLGGVGQAGVYLDAVSNVEIVGNTILNAGAAGIKVQTTTTPAPTSAPRNILIAHNVIDSPGQGGIYVIPADLTAAQPFGNVNVSGNLIRSTGAGYEGIRVDKADQYLVADNMISDSGGRGVRVGGIQNTSQHGRVSGNVISSCQQEALYLQAASSSNTGVVEGNLLIEPALAGGAYSAVYLSTGLWLYRRNVITSAATPYAFNVITHATSVVSMYLNDHPAAKTDQVSGTSVAWDIAAGAGSFTSLASSGTITATGNISGPRALITGVNGVTADVFVGPYNSAGTNPVVYRNASATQGHRWRSDTTITMELVAAGDLELPVDGTGVILNSPNGTRYKLTISDAGAVVVTAI